MMQNYKKAFEPTDSNTRKFSFIILKPYGCIFAGVTDYYYFWAFLMRLMS